MRATLRRGLVLGSLAVGFVLLSLPISSTTPPSRAQVTQGIHLDLAFVPDAPGTYGPGSPNPPIPPDCSVWHELWPNFSRPHHQDAYIDSSGTGTIEPCDNIVLDGIEYHVQWVGPTYFVTCFPQTPGYPPTQAIFEPASSNPGPDPICEIWHEVWPNYCHEIHIDSWFDDNGTGRLDPCDVVDVQNTPIGPVNYHIDSIHVNIIVTEKPTTTRKGSWGWLKNLFR